MISVEILSAHHGFSQTSLSQILIQGYTRIIHEMRQTFPVILHAFCLGNLDFVCVRLMDQFLHVIQNLSAQFTKGRKKNQKRKKRLRLD